MVHWQVSAGGTFTENTLNIAGVGDSTGTVLISGTDSSLSVTNLNMGARAHFPGVATGSGTDRVASLTVEEGATATANVLSVWGADSTLTLAGSTLTVTGNNQGSLNNHAAFLDASALFAMTLDTSGTTPLGLDVSNGLQITDAFLEINKGSGFSAAENDVFQLVRYGSLTGTFQGLPEGAAFWVGNTPFTIQYDAVIGSDSFITLTVIPEPSVFILLIAATGILGLKRNRIGC